jgi:hypothetical protein
MNGGAWTNIGNVTTYAHTGLTPGSSHTYAVRAWNAVGAGTGTATLTRTAPSVCPAVNTSPLAYAGSDRIIRLPISSVTISGASESDSDGTIVSRTWTKTAGPTASLMNENTLTPTFSGLGTSGIYTFTLTVTDDDGAVSSDDMQVAVQPAYVCNDSLDNDSDGFTDYPSDVGCVSIDDDDEMGGVPSLTASPRTVEVGTNTTLSWNLNGQTGCTLTGGTLNLDDMYLRANSTVTLPIGARTTFRLSCTSGGSDQVTVEIIPTGFET